MNAILRLDQMPCFGEKYRHVLRLEQVVCGSRHVGPVKIMNLNVRKIELIFFIYALLMGRTRPAFSASVW